MQILLLFLLLVACNGQDENPVVDTLYGPVQGQRIGTHYDIYVNSFYGIPYAADPVGDMRFERPVPPEPWTEPILAKGLTRACMQGIGGLLWLTHPGFNNYGEDCLNLNVFTPENLSPAEPYPVMVFFHGGGYEGGSNMQYPGHFIAARDVVVVVANYRMGIYGFLNTEDDYNTGNAGMFDQREALIWVRDNIDRFGGDPNRVTMFGQSAGASSSGLHMVSPVSDGLFHAVIEESGCDTSFWAVNWPEQEPWNYTQQVAVKVGCPTEPSDLMVECMKTIDARELEDNSSITCKPGYFCQGHAPVIDGEGNFLPDNPLAQREKGEYSRVPLLSGYNSEDGSVYALAYMPEAMEGGFNRTEFNYLLYERYVKIWEEQFTEQQAEDAYWAVNFMYTPWPYIEDEELNRDAFVDMTTDAAWGYSQDRQLKLQSEVATTYQYIFGYRSLNTTEGVFEGTEWAGVPHAGELPYVFGWPLLQLSPEVRLDCRIPIDIVPWNEEDYEYSDFTIDLFTNFAKYYNPTPEPVEGPIGHGPITWPALTTDELNILWIHREEIEPRINYRQDFAAFWREYLGYVVDKELYSGGVGATMTRGQQAEGLDSSVTETFLQRSVLRFLEDQLSEQDFEDLLALTEFSKSDLFEY